MFLFVTADRIGIETGGGVVTKHELAAMQKLGEVKVINPNSTPNPFDCEKSIQDEDWSKYKLAHFYSGTFPSFAQKLKKAGVKITYTAAAHDVDESKKEFKLYGYEYNYPHLTDPVLLEKYLSSYKQANVVICPSTHSKNVMEKFGCKHVEVVPHGCQPMKPSAHPKTFTVGYLGQIGPDKGIIYLLEAWAKLNYSDAILNIAGANSTVLLDAVRYYRKSNVNLLGWVKSTEKFYNQISLYVQPSVTEGFGIEVLEAMSCNRPVIVSDGAGAADCVHDCGIVFKKRNVQELAEAIHLMKTDQEKFQNFAANCQANVKNYTWPEVKNHYVQIWKELLA